jgi:regulatory protein YycI of two-component signal transduction system YycFG
MEKIKKNKTIIIVAILILAIGYGIGYFTKPTEVKTVTVEKVKIEKQAAETKIVYREKITKPDGTVIEKEQSKTDTVTSENTQSEKSSESVIKNDLGLNLGLLAVAEVNNLAGNREYAVTVSKRVIGNFSVNALATTDKKIGVGIGISF